MYIIAAITLLAEEIYFLYRHKTPPSYKRRLIIIGIVWACISAAAIVVTVDAARSPGLIQDFSAESDSYTTGISLLALSWLAFLLTSMLAMLTFVNGLLVMPVNALPDGSYTGANPRHKVVFHKDMKPLKVIELSQGRDEAALGYGNNQYVQPPQPVHTAWAERYPGQIKTTYNHWPGDFA
ncbi:uncharacterized protein FIBRA_04997 [Fibroporia radiculosa]|uniref:Uncharacterized protein n=1 Tax=Fibroporia radiculosa TaxID=599839 RepID=J4G8B8_9APHY|nr:uncharacterized protein FIBRA_04997 [Fibroporia radiculosa]CCM02883.1 predicted protein [Fibroporia radiculosa]